MPGPKPTVNKEEIKELLNEGMFKWQIAEKLGVSLDTIKHHSKGISVSRKNTSYSCRECGISGKENFYNNARYNCKSCWNKRTIKSQQDNVKEIKDAYGGKCTICGYNKCYGALDFHHVDPQTKDFTIAKHRGKSLSELKDELDKCILVCRNCHAEIHLDIFKENKVK